jgi:hypothetical protein
VRNLIILALLLGIVGLAIGYLIFGRWGITNELIPLRTLFGSADTTLGRAAREVVGEISGLAAKRQSIYISGGVGVVVGAVVGLLIRRRR